MLANLGEDVPHDSRLQATRMKPRAPEPTR